MIEVSEISQRSRDRDQHDHWGQYWAGGALTSLPEDFQANYDGEIQSFWNARFDEVPDGGHVLDICTGNGAIALLAAQRLADRVPAVSVFAIDAAAIRPDAMASRHPGQAEWIQSVQFLPETRFEDFSAPVGQFDLITSQYGIEYCDLEAVADNAHLLLKSGGRLAILSHALGSDMLRTMEAEYRDYRRLDQMQVFRRLDEFLQGDLNPAGFRRALSRMRAELIGQRKRLERPLNRMVLGMIEESLPMTDAAMESARPRYEGFARQLSGGRDRLADMLRVHRMMREDPEWTRVFEQAGLERLSSGTVRYQGQHDVGRFHVFQRP